MIFGMCQEHFVLHLSVQTKHFRTVPEVVQINRAVIQSGLLYFGPPCILGVLTFFVYRGLLTMSLRPSQAQLKDFKELPRPS